MADRHHTINSAIAGAGGTATFTLDAPPPGSTLTGSIGVPLASSTATFTATIGGIVWGAWAGNATFGPVQQWAGEQIVVTASGLSPGSTYGLTFIGMVQDEQATQIIWPSALATAITSTAVTTPTFRGARIAAAANQNAPDAQNTQLTLATIVQDSDGFATPANGLTVPTGLDGTYLIVAEMWWTNPAGAPANAVEMYVDLSGTARNDIDDRYPPAMLQASGQQVAHGSALVALAAGNLLRLYVANNYGGALTLAGGATDAVPRSSLALARLGV